MCIHTHLYTDVQCYITVPHLFTLPWQTSSPKSVSKFKAHRFLGSRPSCFFLSAWFQIQPRPQESSRFLNVLGKYLPGSDKGSLHEWQRHLSTPSQITPCFKIVWPPSGIFECITWESRSQSCKTLQREFSNPKHFNIQTKLKSTLAVVYQLE